MHLFLSSLFVQLYALLDDEPKDCSKQQSFDKVVDRAPTVSLMLCLSKLQQLRVECSRSKALMVPQRVMANLLPAMWGLEMHFRRSQEDHRQAFEDELRNKKHDIDDGSAEMGNLERVKGSVYGFEVPARLLERMLSVVEPGDDYQHVEPEDWSWNEWGWPQDDFMKIFCRIAQVARLSVGVASPVGCWHPSDIANPDYKPVLRAITKQDIVRRNVVGGRSMKERGFCSSKLVEHCPRPDMSQTCKQGSRSIVSQSYKRLANKRGEIITDGKVVIKKVNGELRDDLLNHKSLGIIFRCISNG